ncbi:hypothetical protein CDL15_Pgr017797 [Punica granatum]|uniref:Secreted protein n=1 Tax=Punica granatum TaxID=22663 RepID=A0A218WGE0_PUNGR|nr:hypothetical protein CDL15_Pgr017797 [Punica granatum]PKI31750.1 hypothetical protein CRG98_047861 [Punica granatum]
MELLVLIFGAVPLLDLLQAHPKKWSSMWLYECQVELNKRLSVWLYECHDHGGGIGVADWRHQPLPPIGEASASQAVSVPVSVADSLFYRQDLRASLSESAASS